MSLCLLIATTVVVVEAPRGHDAPGMDLFQADSFHPHTDRGPRLGVPQLVSESDAGRAPRDASWASIRHELFDLWAAGQVGLVFAHSPVSWRGGDEPTMAHPMFVT